MTLDDPGTCTHVAPSKEVLSYRAYTAHRRLNRLRRAACQLYESDAITHVVARLEREVEHGRIAIRADKKVHADVGKWLVYGDKCLSVESVCVTLSFGFKKHFCGVKFHLPFDNCAMYTFYHLFLA